MKVIVQHKLVTKLSVIERGKLIEIEASETAHGCIGFLPVFDNLLSANKADKTGKCTFAVIDIAKRDEP